METIVFELSPALLGAIPLVIALVSAFKGLGLASKFAPFASIALGIGAVALTGASWQISIISGIVIGLSASGLYSSTKTVKNEVL